MLFVPTHYFAMTLLYKLHQNKNIIEAITPCSDTSLMREASGSPSVKRMKKQKAMAQHQLLLGDIMVRICTSSTVRACLFCCCGMRGVLGQPIATCEQSCFQPAPRNKKFPILGHDETRVVGGHRVEVKAIPLRDTGAQVCRVFGQFATF